MKRRSFFGLLAGFVAAPALGPALKNVAPVAVPPATETYGGDAALNAALANVSRDYADLIANGNALLAHIAKNGRLKTYG